MADAPRLVAWADADVARAEAAARHTAGTGHETIHTAGEPHYCAALGCSWSSSDDVTFLDTPEAWAERGADRFAGGYIRAPFLDLGDDFTADRARAWLAGWDAANLATPLETP